MKLSRSFLLYAAIISATIFWGFSFIWIKIVYRELSPVAMVFFRFVLASAFMLVYLTFFRNARQVQRKHVLWFVLLGFFDPFLYFLFESLGLSLVDASTAAVIVATTPLFAPVAAFLMYRERVSLGFFAGLTISMAGVFLVIVSPDYSFSASPLGVLFMFLAVISSIAYLAVLKKLSSDYRPMTIITYQNIFGLLFFTPVFILYGTQGLSLNDFTFPVVISLVQLALFATCLAFIFYVYALHNLGINKTTIFINATPIFTAFFAWLLLGDMLSLRKIMGIAIVIAGLSLSQINNPMLGVRKRFFLYFYEKFKSKQK
jgi:drug/metabolite transporter (DMT)-like permease